MTKAHVAVCDLDNYVQDALDLIEFANGDMTTTWGKLRADMGHPAPFNLKFIGIGNEQWGTEYPRSVSNHLSRLFVKLIRISRLSVARGLILKESILNICGLK